MKLIDNIHGGYIHKRRLSVLSGHFTRLLPCGVSVLDVGSGDGQLAFLIQRNRPDLKIMGIDVLVRKDAAMPVSHFDGHHIPFEAKSFDIVMFADVLHHSQQPMALLREGVRVARRALLIKDHLLEGSFARATLRFMDWVGNKRHGVALPFKYWRSSEWHGALDELELSPSVWESRLGLYPLPASLLFERSLHFVAFLDVKHHND